MTIILTNDDGIADRVKQLRNYGSRIKYQHDLAGYNSRLDEMQAAFLRVKLSVLDTWNEQRRKIALEYSARLADAGVILPMIPEYAEPVWHLYVIRSKNREALKTYLESKRITTVIHYPTPPHRQLCYQEFSNYHLPIADSLASEVLSLPMSSAVDAEEITHIVNAVLEYKTNL